MNRSVYTYQTEFITLVVVVVVVAAARSKKKLVETLFTKIE